MCILETQNNRNRKQKKKEKKKEKAMVIHKVQESDGFAESMKTWNKES